MVDTFMPRNAPYKLVKAYEVWPLVWEQLALHSHVRSIVVHFTDTTFSVARWPGRRRKSDYFSTFVLTAKQLLGRWGYNGGK